MPRDVNGNYILPRDWTDDAAGSVEFSPEKFDEQDADIAVAINDIGNPDALLKWAPEGTSPASVPPGTISEDAQGRPLLKLESLSGWSTAIADAVDHAARTDNPHGVTAAQVGLGNADNTSDVDKPISTATQAAFDALSLNVSSALGIVNAIQSLAGVSAFGTLMFATKAELDVALNYTANTGAWVYGDAIAANNGTYVKNGAAGVGSWARIGDLPFSVIPLTIVGGTANAIIASSTLPVPQADNAAIFMMMPLAANTGPVTLTINGETPKAVFDSTGADLANDALIPNRLAFIVPSGGQYRLAFSSDVIAAAALVQAAVDGFGDINGAIDAARLWATKTDGIVDAIDYSSKAWSIGGDGVTGVAGAGAAKEWATNPINVPVDGSVYSAFHYASEADTARSAAVVAQALAESGAAVASAEADRAEAARDAAFVNANVYASIAAGLAAVADGVQFTVVEGIELVRYRRDTASTYTEMARFPTLASFGSDMPPGSGFDSAVVGTDGGVLSGNAFDGTAITPVGLHAMSDGFALMTDVNGVKQVARVNEYGTRQLTRGPDDKQIIGMHSHDSVIFARTDVPAGEPVMGLARKNINTLFGKAPYTAPVVKMVFTYGQSLVFGTTNTTQSYVINSDPPEPEKIFGFAVMNPRSNYTPAGLGPLVPAVESMYGGPPGGTGESPQLAFAQAVLDAHDHYSPVIVFGGGQGGTALVDLLPGTTPYANTMAMVQVAYDLAVAKWPGCTVEVAAINLEHGQNDYFTATSTYQSQVTTLFAGFDTDIAAITGQTTPPYHIVGQNRRINTGQLRGADVAILDFATADTSALWRQTPYTLQFDDNITHLLSPSYIRRGSLAGQAYAARVREGRRLLLKIEGAVRTNNVVDVTFSDLPTKLTLDPTIYDDGTLGFWYDDNNTLLLTDNSAFVREARITGDRTVRVYLNTTPTGTAKRISIAWADVAGTNLTPSRKIGVRTPLCTHHNHVCPWTGEPLLIRPAGQALSIV